jgi:hypothetical protein
VDLVRSRVVLPGEGATAEYRVPVAARP